MEFHISLFIYYFQYKQKAICIMLNLMLPLVGVVNIMKINQYQIH
jgi:hypothetical protein